MSKDSLIAIPSLVLLLSAPLSFTLAAEEAASMPSPAEAAVSAPTSPATSAASGVEAATEAQAQVPGTEPAPEDPVDASVIPRAAFSPCDAALAKRVEMRWQAMVSKDFAKAYQFTLPSYRETNSAQQFAGRIGDAVTWRGATVKSIQYRGPESALVSIEVEVEYVPSWGGVKQPALTRVDETWLSREGSWWLSLSR